MKSQQTVKVTEQDIAKATVADSRSCMVATALARTLPDITHLTVDMQFIKFSEAGERYTFATPPAVQSYIIDFDYGDPILPFSFRLDKANRMILQRYVRTEEGKAVARKLDEVKRRRKDAALVVADPIATPTEKRKAKEKVRRAEEAVEVLKEQLGSLPRGRREPPVRTRGEIEEGHGVVRAAPTRKKGRSHVRVYGQRVMRINQARAAQGQDALA